MSRSFSFQFSSSGSGSSNAFTIIQPDSGTSPTATSGHTTLTLTSSDSSISITGNSVTNTIDLKIGSTLSTSFVDILALALGTTQVANKGLLLENTTAAAAGAQQISPAIAWKGRGWKTNATAGSQSVDFREYLLPVQGTANPTGSLIWQSAVNAGSFTTRMILNSNNGFSVPGSGLNSERFGNLSFSGGLESLVVGYNSNATGDGSTSLGPNISANSGQYTVLVGGSQTTTRSYCTAVGVNSFVSGADLACAFGYLSQASTNYSIAIGTANAATGDAAIMIGSNGIVSNNFSIGIGYQAATFADNQLVTTVYDFYLGGGNNTNTADKTINANGPGAGYTNTAAASLILISGRSTGTALSGDLAFQIAPAASTSGSTKNTPTDRLRIYSDNGRSKFTGIDDFPAPPTSGSDSSVYADGTFYTGYATANFTARSYKLYSVKLDTSSNPYYSPSPFVFNTLTDNNSMINGSSPNSGAESIFYYPFGTDPVGTYPSAGTIRDYRIIAIGTVNGVPVSSPSPLGTTGTDGNVQIYPGDATAASAIQQSGGAYTPASTDQYEYLIYAHAVYNGVDIYSSSPAYAIVTADGITDPYYLQVSWTDATFPVDATVTDYTIVQNINGAGYDRFVTGVPVGGAYNDTSPSNWIISTPTITPNTTPVPYRVTLTWNDPSSFDQAVLPGSRIIQIQRQVNGGGYNEAVNVTYTGSSNSFEDTGDSLWVTSPSTAASTVPNFFTNNFSWTAPSGNTSYKMLKSLNNFVAITTSPPSSAGFPGITYGSGSYTANGQQTDYEIWAYQQIDSTNIYASANLGYTVTDDNSGLPYTINLTWNAPTFSPLAIATGYVIQRQINGGGFTDYRYVAGLLLDDDNTGWTTGTPTLTPTTGYEITATIIANPALTSFVDTGALPWSDPITVTPTSQAATTVTINPVGSGIDINSNYQLPSIAPPGAGYVLSSTAGSDALMAWQILSLSALPGIVNGSQLPYGTNTVGQMLFTNNIGLFTTSSSPIFDFGTIYQTMRVPAVLMYSGGLQLSASSSVSQWQQYAAPFNSSTNTSFQLYNLQSPNFGIRMVIDGDRDNFLFQDTNGTTRPNNTALFDMSSTTRGILIPRMTTTQRNAISSPATGLMVRDTSLALFYEYTGAAWSPLVTTDAALSTSDITTNNVSTSKHGFAPKAPNDATQYLDGTAAYSVPVGAFRPKFDHFADAGNTTTTKTDLYSDTLAAGLLATNGDKISAYYGGLFVSSATATREITLSFGGTDIFDSGALTLSLSSAWTIYVDIIRVSSSVIRYMISMTTEGAESTTIFAL